MTKRKPKAAVSPLIEAQPTQPLQPLPVSADRQRPAGGYQNRPTQTELRVSWLLPNRGKITLH